MPLFSFFAKSWWPDRSTPKRKWCLSPSKTLGSFFLFPQKLGPPTESHKRAPNWWSGWWKKLVGASSIPPKPKTHTPYKCLPKSGAKTNPFLSNPIESLNHRCRNRGAKTARPLSSRPPFRKKWFGKDYIEMSAVHWVWKIGRSKMQLLRP